MLPCYLCEDEAAIRGRAREHLEAGADRILVFDFDPRQGPGLLEALAPAEAAGC
ncbi:MAG: hypothetical protein JRH19_10965 [Deltaproteobacteria bacterium]|nr:hypothetical protein [Deltaproteobacteria bacterium]